MKQIEGGVTAVGGVRASGIAAGLKKNRKKDMALIALEEPAVAAGAFTVNRVKAAPVLLCQQYLRGHIAQAVIINSGNANACTGEQGLLNAQRMSTYTAEQLGISSHLVLVASTGVIGQQLPMEIIEPGIEAATQALDLKGGHDAAEAIMTTDLVSKESAVEIEVAKCPVRIGGMAKGSGMIHPNMATMLAFITTDVSIHHTLLQSALRASVERSFNSITVDGDMSTNDTVLLFTTGDAQNPTITEPNADYCAFREGLDHVTTELAKAIARDGEGATKLVRVYVKGARNTSDADKAARAIAGSSLVKTAIFGMDANWGRIIAALGYSGAEFEPYQIDIWLDELQLVRNGMDAGFSESTARELFERDELSVIVDLKAGDGEQTIWTCDFSYDYVKINASYRS